MYGLVFGRLQFSRARLTGEDKIYRNRPSGSWCCGRGVFACRSALLAWNPLTRFRGLWATTLVYCQLRYRTIPAPEALRWLESPSASGREPFAFSFSSSRGWSPGTVIVERQPGAPFFSLRQPRFLWGRMKSCLSLLIRIEGKTSFQSARAALPLPPSRTAVARLSHVGGCMYPIHW